LKKLIRNVFYLKDRFYIFKTNREIENIQNYIKDNNYFEYELNLIDINKNLFIRQVYNVFSIEKKGLKKRNGNSDLNLYRLNISNKKLIIDLEYSLNEYLKDKNINKEDENYIDNIKLNKFDIIEYFTIKYKLV
jgi:hypothetical protein